MGRGPDRFIRLRDSVITHSTIRRAYIRRRSSGRPRRFWGDPRQRNFIHSRIRWIATKWCRYSRTVSHVRKLQWNGSSEHNIHGRFVWIRFVLRYCLWRDGYRCHLGFCYRIHHKIYPPSQSHRAYIYIRNGLSSVSKRWNVSHVWNFSVSISWFISYRLSFVYRK